MLFFSLKELEMFFKKAGMMPSGAICKPLFRVGKRQLRAEENTFSQLLVLHATLYSFSATFQEEVIYFLLHYIYLAVHSSFSG